MSGISVCMGKKTNNTIEYEDIKKRGRGLDKIRSLVVLL